MHSDGVITWRHMLHMICIAVAVLVHWLSLRKLWSRDWISLLVHFQTVRICFWSRFEVSFGPKVHICIIWYNSNLLIWNGLQSVRWPSKHAKNNARIIIFQSILYLNNVIWWIFRPTRWDRRTCQVQIMTNQTVLQT